LAFWLRRRCTPPRSNSAGLHWSAQADLSLNHPTANALGPTVPQTLLACAEGSPTKIDVVPVTDRGLAQARKKTARQWTGGP
jgi:hypothetical protein